MTDRARKLLLWSPRILGVLVALFLGLFALDSFDGEKSLIQALVAFAGHLAPTFFLLAVVGVSWRWEWVGAFIFTGCAAAYAYFAREHASWILFIAGPLLVVGLLFSCSWVQHRPGRSNA